MQTLFSVIVTDVMQRLYGNSVIHRDRL